MYMSQIMIDVDLRSAMRAMASPQVMHAIIEGGFESSDKKLWRLDGEKLLVVSSRPPSDPAYFAQLSTEAPLTKDYQPFLNSIEEKRDYYFRMAANPVHSVPSSVPGKRGKVLAHVTTDQQMEWLRSREGKLGVVLQEYNVRSSEFVKFKRNSRTVTLKLAVFEGLLTVVDKAQLMDVMTNGYGRAKAYGAGLLTLIP